MTAAGDWGVFVDELKLVATASEGLDWWVLFQARQHPSRFTYLAMTPQGGHLHVACDSQEAAEMLRDLMGARGMNPKLTKVARLSACRKTAERRTQKLTRAASW